MHAKLSGCWKKLESLINGVSHCYIIAIMTLGYLINIVLVYFIHDFGTLLILEGLVFLLGAIFALIVFNLAYKTYDLIYSIP